MHNLNLGNIVIRLIREQVALGQPVEVLFPSADPQTLASHCADLPKGLIDEQSRRVVLAYQSFLIETPQHLILVDTCNGACKTLPARLEPPANAWMSALRATGYEPADIDFVFCTHLHFDHTGWNTSLVDGRWQPTFPNAKYIFDRREYTFWESLARDGRTLPPHRTDIWEMNCLPIAQAGQARFIAPGFEIAEGIEIIDAPGHSPGHCCLRASSGGQEALMVGDLFYHLLQCWEPDWSTPYCWDGDLAATSRRRILTEAAERQSIILPGHFPDPTAGRVKVQGKGFGFHFL